MILSVKLLGLEGQRSEAFRDARCTVQYIPKRPPESEMEDATPGGLGAFSRVTGAFRSGASKLSLAAERVKNVSGLGFGSRYRGVPLTMKSTKAVPWASVLEKDQRAITLPGVVVRAIEQLHYRENWPHEKIAQMFGVDVSVVEAAAKLRANFQVAWHHSLHFVVLPGDNPLGGIIEISVSVPGQAKTELVKQSNRLVSASEGITDKSGKIGSVRIHLNQEPIKPDTRWRRRVRARLRRSKDQDVVVDPAPGEALTGDSQCDESVGNPVAGVLVEFMVELRHTFVADAKDSLGEGQEVPMDYSQLEELTAPFRGTVGVLPDTPIPRQDDPNVGLRLSA